MKLAISNIAWPLEDEGMVAEKMQGAGLRGVEIAPTKIWPQPLAATREEAVAYRTFWSDHDISIVALQALLYGRPDLTIFESKSKRRETLDYLERIMALAGWLGATALVFGSPKNRKVGDLSEQASREIALEFFFAAGERAARHDTILCLEPNPTAYHCDFINTSAEGLALVQAVNHPGFGLHLDAAGLTLSEEPLAESLRACEGKICHFHASEPFLGRLGLGESDHGTIGRTLRQMGYPNWVSVEMRHDSEHWSAAELARILTYLQAKYLLR